GHMVDRLGYVKSGLAYPLLATNYEIIPSKDFVKIINQLFCIVIIHGETFICQWHHFFFGS
ncbi:hypothetical protein ACUOCP_53040, partial [Escherichia sp. R-CC3]